MCTCVCASKQTQHKTDTCAIRGARMRIVTDGVYIVSTEMCFHMYYFNDSYGRRTGMCGQLNACVDSFLNACVDSGMHMCGQ